MSVRVVPYADLTQLEIEAWSRFQQSDPALASPYFRPEFVACVAAVRNDVEIGVLEDNGTPRAFFPFQRSHRHIAKPVGGRVSDYHGVIAEPDYEWNADVLLRSCKLAAWDFDHVPTAQRQFTKYRRGTDQSPYLDLSSGFESYRQHLRKAGQDELRQTLRKNRKLSREIGAVRLEYDVPDSDILQQMIRWKSQQYRRTRATDVFSYGWTVSLLERILQERKNEFGGVLSVLFAKDTPIAIHMGMRCRDNLHWWFPTYDPEFARYSPGRILLAELAMAAPSHGIGRIDLGRGVVGYKARAMSGAVELAEGSVELRPLARVLREGIRNATDWIRSSPLRGPVRVPGRIIYRVREWMAFR